MTTKNLRIYFIHDAFGYSCDHFLLNAQNLILIKILVFSLHIQSQHKIQMKIIFSDLKQSRSLIIFLAT